MFSLLATKFSRYLENRQFPVQWKESKMILLPKKGSRNNIGNFRPISLLSVVYKVFTRIIVTRLESTLDREQPVTQAGFRSGFCCMDHIHTLRQVIEKSKVYRIPLVLIFVDYKKAFDSVELNGVWNSLDEQGVDSHYIEILRSLNSNTFASIRPFERKLEVKLEKGVRQGDTISPKLFSAALESVMRKMDWDDKGINVDGVKLNHLRFADDVVIISNSVQEAAQMLNDLATESARIGLQVNEGKTQVMRNEFSTTESVLLGNRPLTETKSYVYLGVLFTPDGSISEELKRRRRAAWAAYDQVRETLNLVRDPNIRANLFSSHVIPALCYGCECWPLSTNSVDYVVRAYRGLERSLVGLTRRQQRQRELSSEELRRRSRIPDIVNYIERAKHRWAGHVMRRCDSRWTKRATEWTVRTSTRGPGRPITRWSDSLDELSLKPRHVRRSENEGRSTHSHFVHWSTIAQDRLKWKHSDPRGNNR